MTLYSPESEEEVVRIVQERAEATAPIEILGNGTKRGYGHQVDTEDKLSTKGLSGVLVYEPSELVISARAGTRVHEIETVLAAENQCLAFDPPDLGPLYSNEAGCGTLGGMIGANLSGPRRMVYGAARDHILGFKAVNGRGELFQSGGRVVKNVTGFDLSKLMTGSFGTLGVLTEVTLKVLPAPKQVNTLILKDLTLATAARHAQQIRNAEATISGLAYHAGELDIRIEGTEVSVAEQRKSVANTLGREVQTFELSGAQSKRFWKKFADAQMFAGSQDPIWRLSVPPMQIVQAFEALPDESKSSVMTDFGSGQIWFANRGEDISAELHKAVSDLGGSATLMRGSAELRRKVPVFTPMPGPLAQITENVRTSFDPLRVLNPGKMGPCP
jgi:glycolate oxidase FAD binding subunit